MNEAAEAPGIRSNQQYVVLTCTTLVQAFSSAAMLLVPTLAPQLARSLDIPVALAGLQMSALYGVAMLVSAQAGAWVQGHGGCRISQYAMLLVVLGCLTIAGSSPLLLLLGTAALGFSYGLTNPAAAHLLTRFTTPARRNLVFSIKQTGVPLGGMIAGVCAPPVAYWLGWQAAFVGLALMAGLLALGLQGWRSAWDDDRRPGRRARRFSSLYVLRHSRPTLWLGLMGCFLAAGQLSLLTYLVVFMVEELSIALVAAGLVMSAVHLSGVCGRIAWGAVADRVGSSIAVLSALALSMAGLFIATALIDADWPRWLVVAIFCALGATAVGWNGVYLAAVAQRNPPDAVSDATGAVLALTYLGVLMGPSLFALVLSASGSFGLSFLLPAFFAALALVCLALCRRATALQTLPAAAS
jgi:predicted MFS family arabinose efflux permease